MVRILEPHWKFFDQMFGDSGKARYLCGIKKEILWLTSLHIVSFI